MELEMRDSRSSLFEKKKPGVSWWQEDVIRNKVGKRALANWVRGKEDAWYSKTHSEEETSRWN